jgi:hypothetical protein
MEICKWKSLFSEEVSFADLLASFSLWQGHSSSSVAITSLF